MTSEREETHDLLAEIVKALESACAEADAIQSLLDLYGIDSTRFVKEHSRFVKEHSRFDDAGDAHYPPGRSTP